MGSTILCRGEALCLIGNAMIKTEFGIINQSIPAEIYVICQFVINLLKVGMK